jgi:hypothetical protein
MNPILNWLKSGNNTLIATGVVITLFLLMLFKCNDDYTDSSLVEFQRKKEAAAAAADTLNKPKPETPLERLDRAQDELSDINLASLNAGPDFSTAVDEMLVNSQLVKQGKKSKDKAIIKATEKYEKQLIAYQKKWFPKLRKRYVEVSAERLWENNIYVDVQGSSNKTISFTSGYFANNGNIKSTQEELHEMLIKLRFTRSIYKWMKYADEYTSYTIESLDDGQLQ